MFERRLFFLVCAVFGLTSPAAADGFTAPLSAFMADAPLNASITIDTFALTSRGLRMESTITSPEFAFPPLPTFDAGLMQLRVGTLQGPRVIHLIPGIIDSLSPQVVSLDQITPKSLALVIEVDLAAAQHATAPFVADPDDLASVSAIALALTLGGLKGRHERSLAGTEN